MATREPRWYQGWIGELVVAWAEGDDVVVAPWFDDDAVYSLAGASAEVRGSAGKQAKIKSIRSYVIPRDR